MSDILVITSKLRLVKQRQGVMINRLRTKGV